MSTVTPPNSVNRDYWLAFLYAVLAGANTSVWFYVLTTALVAR